ncbi:hypothetical protein FOZ61_001626, partial [Perkinsus olseni]
ESEAPPDNISNRAILRRSRSAVPRSGFLADEPPKAFGGPPGAVSPLPLTNVELHQHEVDFVGGRPFGHRSDRALMFAQAPKLAALSGNTYVVQSRSPGVAGGGLMLLPSGSSPNLRYASSDSMKGRPDAAQQGDLAISGRSAVTRLPRLSGVVRGGRGPQEDGKFSNLRRVLDLALTESGDLRRSLDDETDLPVPPASPANKFHEGDGMGWSRGAGIGSLQYGKTNTDRHLLAEVAAGLKMREVCDGIAALEVARKCCHWMSKSQKSVLFANCFCGTRELATVWEATCRLKAHQEDRVHPDERNSLGQAASFAEASVLTFEYTPQWEDDTVYFAYTFP